jgi:hypothetical protein
MSFTVGRTRSPPKYVFLDRSKNFIRYFRATVNAEAGRLSSRLLKNGLARESPA